MEKLEKENLVQLEPTLLYSKVGDEIVLLTVESGKYFRVDAVGSRIWELIKEPTSVQSLVEQLTDEYDITKDECLDDVRGFLDELRKDELILVS